MITFYQKLTMLLLAILVLFNQASAQDYEWKLKKQVEDLKIYHRKSEVSKVNEVRIELVVQATLANIVSVIRDVSAFREWIYKIDNSRRLDSLSSSDIIMYSVINFPWPMQDRDYAAQVHLHQDPDSKVVTSRLVGIPDYVPEENGKVRIKDLEVNWLITPMDAGMVQIEYQLRTDPGGAVPAWMINMAIDQGPIESMKKFREMLKKEKYQNARLSFISEVK